MKALVVEDLLPAFIAAKAILSQYGFEVDKAVDGVEGTEKATSNNYTLILMDICLPKMNGIEATKAIREAGVDAPIFALSANLGEHKRETLIDAGMQAGYEKPQQLIKFLIFFIAASLLLPKVLRNYSHNSQDLIREKIILIAGVSHLIA